MKKYLVNGREILRNLLFSALLVGPLVSSQYSEEKLVGQNLNVYQIQGVSCSSNVAEAGFWDVVGDIGQIVGTYPYCTYVISGCIAGCVSVLGISPKCDSIIARCVADRGCGHFNL